jgi:DNA repair photolyase
MYRVYKTKTILNTHKNPDGGWFWDKYSAFPYMGCEWGCSYCYWRDEKYNPHKVSRDQEVLKYEDAFSQYIKVKENAPGLLEKALRNKPKDLIYLDNYQPIDAQHHYAGKMLEVCWELGFPVFINEKSPMLLQDLSLLKKMNKKSYLNVGWSVITTKDDQTRLLFEPKAPATSSRFEAMALLAENGILTGTVFMPILPFIYDREENIEAVVKKTKESGGQYVLEGGLTLWGRSKTFFYEALRKYDSELIRLYDELYKSRSKFAQQTERNHRLVLKYCKEYGLFPYIPRPTSCYPEKIQMNKKIAEKFYLHARELQLSGKGGFEEWAYRKAAWSLDRLEEDLETIYRAKGLKGVMEIPCIGESLAKQIGVFLEEDGEKLLY